MRAFLLLVLLALQSLHALKLTPLASQFASKLGKFVAAGVVAGSFISPAHAEPRKPVASNDVGANTLGNAKIMLGGASTLQRGISKSMTRGVNLSGSDFSGQNLKGVAFQQSIVRDSSFKGSNLYSASFFEYVHYSM